ncbi:hypothetical protein NQ318_004962 [Aromia moschata]|uniref:Uncharacterized protein n=1 Tax=Aromia moschata TaxID=1265417 RepID=A0AAV8XC33_9CUCU|nr:hypothetical protein NQ318_004962 [Aromia moschata]
MSLETISGYWKSRLLFSTKNKFMPERNRFPYMPLLCVGSYAKHPWDKNILSSVLQRGLWSHQPRSGHSPLGQAATTSEPIARLVLFLRYCPIFAVQSGRKRRYRVFVIAIDEDITYGADSKATRNSAHPPDKDNATSAPAKEHKTILLNP